MLVLGLALASAPLSVTATEAVVPGSATNDVAAAANPSANEQNPGGTKLAVSFESPPLSEAKRDTVLAAIKTQLGVTEVPASWHELNDKSVLWLSVTGKTYDELTDVVLRAADTSAVQAAGIKVSTIAAVMGGTDSGPDERTATEFTEFAFLVFVGVAIGGTMIVVIGIFAYRKLHGEEDASGTPGKLTLLPQDSTVDMQLNPLVS